jgi:tRNA A37 threonylcarbamoyladenosine synthetase subunit TsaC/SUA5/YrdC
MDASIREALKELVLEIWISYPLESVYGMGSTPKG